jgi:hypothetical protein
MFNYSHEVDGRAEGRKGRNKFGFSRFLGKREDRNLSPPFSPVLLLYGKQKLS